MAFYLHLGPFARQVIAAIDAKLAEIDIAEEMVALAPAIRQSL
jgi:hypothetical protein